MAVAALSVSLAGLGGCAGAQIKGNEGKVSGAVIGAGIANAAAHANPARAGLTVVGAIIGWFVGKKVADEK